MTDQERNRLMRFASWGLLGLIILIAAVAASVIFGIYHFAHSPPFNEVNMVMFLMIPAIAPSVAYFIGRDIYAAIIVQNFLGIVGVMGTIDLAAYSQPLFQMYVLTLPAIAALITANIIVMRKRFDLKTEASLV